MYIEKKYDGINDSVYPGKFGMYKENDSQYYKYMICLNNIEHCNCVEFASTENYESELKTFFQIGVILGDDRLKGTLESFVERMQSKK